MVFVCFSALRGDDCAASTGEEDHAVISSSFDELGRRLRGLTGLPLDIASVQGASPVFRNTEVGGEQAY